MDPAIVLTYHAGNVAGADYAGNDHIALREDLAMFSREGWRVVPLAWIVEQRLGAGWRDLSRCLALTCDDGTDLDVRAIDYPGQGRQSGFLPCLQAAKTPADSAQPWLEMTSFVIADPMTRARMDAQCLHGLGWMNEDWWARAQASGLMPIACHSWDHNHAVAPGLGPDDMPRGDFFQVDSEARAAYEIDQAVDYLNARLGSDRCRYFAYPYGHAPDFLTRDYLPRHAERLGLQAAFGTQGEPVTADSDIWHMPRYVCGWHWKSSAELLEILGASERRAA